MNTNQRTRGHFEERLLGELRQLVATQPSKAEPPVRRPLAWVPSPPGRLALLGSTAVLLLVGLVTGVVFFTGGATPAYAVTTNDDGTVTVEINSLSDAAGLESKLRDVGVRAVVQYLQPGQVCKAAARAVDDSAAPRRVPIRGGVESTGEGHVRFTISNNVPADETLLIGVSGTPGGSGPASVGITVAQDEHPQCEIVSADDPAGAPGGTFHTEEGGKPGPGTSSSQ